MCENGQKNVEENLEWVRLETSCILRMWAGRGSSLFLMKHLPWYEQEGMVPTPLGDILDTCSGLLTCRESESITIPPKSSPGSVLPPVPCCGKARSCWPWEGTRAFLNPAGLGIQGMYPCSPASGALLTARAAAQLCWREVNDKLLVPWLYMRKKCYCSRVA